MIQNVLQYLEQSADIFAGKTAVAFGEEKYTFGELMSLARRQASIMREYQNQLRPVCVFANRNAKTVVLFFAVLFSGNYYVPLDPDMPAIKMQMILEDCDPVMILGEKENREKVEELGYSERFRTMLEVGVPQCDLPAVGGDAPVYMVYTSGSTGKPKGVLKSHGAVISYVEAFCRTFQPETEDIIGNQTPFFFDASAKDLYLMLKKGMTMEIIPPELFLMPPSLIEYMNEKEISYISWVPSALSIVTQLNVLSYIKPEKLKRVFFVGEVMPMKQLNRWRAALPDVQYVNLYGSSEIAGICCYQIVSGNYLDTDVLPLGRALSNCKLYLIDQDTQELISEPGRIGEIYVVSDALALEYFHDPQKTAECFLHRDFGEGTVRCFKSGDLAQYSSDGTLVFAARKDFQIKHMGHRIELGEIESVGNALPEIQLCCCLYHKEKSHIVLFCELTPGSELSPNEVRSLLKGSLSSYMQPNKVFILEKLPKNANGKIDRMALQECLTKKERKKDNG